MHTTASDGRLTPAELVARAAAAGLTTISVTDHDTVAAIPEVTAAATAVGIRVVPGIELTAIDNGRDVHMLGYFFDPASPPLVELLVSQRGLRISRVREIAARLASLNMNVDVDWILLAAAARPGSSVGRPQIARELVRAGYVDSVQQAFDRWLANGRPAYVERTGPSPSTVVDTIHAAGGVASMAHPGVTRRDDLIEPLIRSGLDALEVYHSDHTPEDVIEYRGKAVRFNALITGGSDFHGEEPPGIDGKPARPGRPHRSTFGAVRLPANDFAALEERARLRQGSGEAGAQS